MSKAVASVRLCCLDLLDTVVCLHQSCSIIGASAWWTDVPQRLPSALVVLASVNGKIRRNLITAVFLGTRSKKRQKEKTGCTGDSRANCHFPHLEYAPFPPHAPSPNSRSPFEFLPSSTGENHSVPCHPANV